MSSPFRGAAPRAFARFGLVLLLAATLLTFAPSAAARPGERHVVPVLVPDLDDMSLLAFWVARGAGYFESEGVDVQPVAPPERRMMTELFPSSGVAAAVLTGQEYTRLLANEAPILLAANLLENDPAALVLRRDTVARIHANTAMPLERRLHLMRDLEMAVALPERTRLYSLFFAGHEDVNQARIYVAKPEEIARALGEGKIDGAYVSSPLLERAVAEQDGVVLVSPPDGEVPGFGKRVALALAVTRAFAKAEPAAAAALVRAIGRAEALVRANPKAAAIALERALPQTKPGRLERIAEIYRHAVPRTPAIDPKRIPRELEFFPAGVTPPDLAKVNLASFVLPAPPVASTGLGARGVLALGGGAVLLFALLVAFFESRERAERAES
ncbi:MAG TPA: ABC transporter substrate-binding protein [Polyangiaceae bacterium]